MDAQTVENPAEALTRLALRTLNMLYAGFWFALLIYLAVLFALPKLPGGEATVRLSASGAPRNWGQWQLFLSALALVSVYVSYRLRPALLEPQRVLRGAPDLQTLSRRYLLETASASDETAAAHRAAIRRALQDVFSRLISRFVILWILVEIPAILGVIDRVASGEIRLFLALTVLSAVGLLVQRPTRERLGGLNAS
jgi:hypothetical protein